MDGQLFYLITGSRYKLCPGCEAWRPEKSFHGRMFITDKKDALQAICRRWARQCQEEAWGNNYRREQARADKHYYRALFYGSGGTYCVYRWKILCALYSHRCLCCGEKTALTVDHVRPLSLGGTNTIENLQPLCASCNSSKKDKIRDYRWSVDYSWSVPRY